MKRLILPLFILLTLALLAALFVQERQAQKFNAQITEITRQLMKSELQCKKQSARIGSMEKNQEISESQALRERLHTVAAAAPETNPDAAPSPTPTDPKPGFSGMLKKMMADPQMKKAVVQQQMTALRQFYADFIKQAGLGPQDAEKFFLLLADRAEAMMDLGAGDAQQPRKDFKEDFKALLGDQRAAQFEAFEKTMSDRMAMTQLNQQLAPTGAQLNEGQTQGLMQILSEERTKSPASPFKAGGTDPMNISTEEMDRYFQQQAEINERIRTRAMSLLTSQQMEQFKTYQNQNLEMQKMGMKMAKTMFSPEKEK